MKLRPDELSWLKSEVSMDTLMEAVDEGIIEVFDGCMVETDGQCQHGYRSPLLILGMI